MQIAVIGPSQPGEQETVLAEKVGQLLAERGLILLSGGEEGVMEAACKGAKEAGGTVVGILGGTNRAEANPFLTVSVVTGIGMARNTILIRSADAIALGGWRISDASGAPIDGDVQRAATAEEAVTKATQARTLA